MKNVYANLFERLNKCWPSGKVNDEELNKNRQSAISKSKNLDINCLLVFKTALCCVMTPRRIQDGFRISGIFPVSVENTIGQCLTQVCRSFVTKSNA